MVPQRWEPTRRSGCRKTRRVLVGSVEGSAPMRVTHIEEARMRCMARRPEACDGRCPHHLRGPRHPALSEQRHRRGCRASADLGLLGVTPSMVWTPRRDGHTPVRPVPHGGSVVQRPSSRSICEAATRGQSRQGPREPHAKDWPAHSAQPAQRDTTGSPRLSNGARTLVTASPGPPLAPAPTRRDGLPMLAGVGLQKDAPLLGADDDRSAPGRERAQCRVACEPFRDPGTAPLEALIAGAHGSVDRRPTTPGPAEALRSTGSSTRARQSCAWRPTLSHL